MVNSVTNRLHMGGAYQDRTASVNLLSSTEGISQEKVDISQSALKVRSKNVWVRGLCDKKGHAHIHLSRLNFGSGVKIVPYQEFYISITGVHLLSALTSSAWKC